MVDGRVVDQWLAQFVGRLRNIFGDRLVFVGHSGSWARGEGEPTSDIDSVVVLDRIDSKDLTEYRHIIAGMPDAKRLASGRLVSISEVRTLPPFELMEFFYGCKGLHGTLKGIVEKPTSIDLLEHVRIQGSQNLFDARHYLVYPHDLSKVVHRLYHNFKSCFYILQSWILLHDGRFLARKDELLGVLSDTDDQEVIQVGRDWRHLEQDREKRPLHYIELLERWSRKMLSRVQIYRSHGIHTRGDLE